MQNLRHMQNEADRHNIALRPHIKTHKSITFAKEQIGLGAVGITVAKLSEALLMAEHGILDIFIANQIVQPAKIKKLLQLNQKANITVGVDHPLQISMLQNALSASNKKLNVRIEIDSGLGRCGLLPHAPMVLDLAKEIYKCPNLKFDGVFTHAGHAYSAQSYQEIKQIAQNESESVRLAAKRIKELGIEVATISSGSTPTAKEGMKQHGITEFRPGNYIFYDAMQVALGVCKPNQISFSVLATVISQPAEDRIVCDAGSKTLNLDKGAHSSQLLPFYGHISNLEGDLIALSEEHGIIKLKKAESIAPGSMLHIIPNHACTVANLFSHYHVVDNTQTVQKISVSARGLSQ